MNMSQVSRVLLYLVMIVLVVCASRYHLQSQLLSYTGTNEVTQALRLSAIMIMEQNEYQVYDREEQQAATLEQQYHKDEEDYNERIKYDQEQSLRSRTRSADYEHLAEMDIQYANRTYYKMIYDDQLRLELVRNISVLEDEVSQPIQSNPCHSWFVFESFCTLLRILPDQHQQKEREEESKELLKERTKLGQVEKDEFINGIVTAILEGFATNYNHTADELLQVSQEWDNKMKQDIQIEEIDSQLEQRYNSTEQDLLNRMRQEKLWLQTNKEKADTLLRDATNHMKLARRYTKYSIVLAIITTLYFVSQLIRHGVVIVTSLVQHIQIQNHDNDSTDFYCTILWRVSYMVQHVIIYLLVSGMMDTNDIVDYDTSDIKQRVLLIASFSYLAAGLQTTFLHTIPLFIYGTQYPITSLSAIYNVGMQFVLRMGLYFLSFIIEFILILITIRRNVFSEEQLKMYGSDKFVLFFLIMVTLHIAFLEKYQWNQIDEQSTALLSSDDSNGDDDISIAASMSTSDVSQAARSGVISISPTEDMPLIFLRGSAAVNLTHLSISSSRGGRFDIQAIIDLRWEFMKLLVLIDLLWIVYSVTILGCGITGSMFALTLMVLLGIAITSFVYSRYITDVVLPSATIANEYNGKRLEFTKAFQTYNTIDTESRM